MKLRFCGVRGSTPAPGAEFVRVGGHTSCVAVWPADAPLPSLVLDAGTGLRAVTPLLGGAPFRGTILLTHLHWDHVQGIPFFTGGDRADADVRLLVPDDGVPAFDQLARAMSPPHFPIGPDGLLGSWHFESLTEGWHDIEGLRVLAREIPHKGGTTFGYRVEGADGSFAYLPDHLPASADGDGEGARDLVRDVDLLVHDAQFVDAESDAAAAYGHATVDQAIELAREGGVGELVLFHHAPSRTDGEVEAIVREARARGGLAVRHAVEGAEISLGAGTGSSHGRVARAPLTSTLPGSS